MKLLKYQIETLASLLREKDAERLKKEIDEKIKLVNRVALEKKSIKATAAIKKFSADFPEVLDQVLEYNFKRKNKCDNNETMFNLFMAHEKNTIAKKLKKEITYNEAEELVILKSMECSNIIELKKVLNLTK